MPWLNFWNNKKSDIYNKFITLVQATDLQHMNCTLYQKVTTINANLIVEE